MKSGERQRRILNLLSNRDYLDVGYLIETLDSSPATIRRDLVVMEKAGLIRKSRGRIASMAAPAFDLRNMVQDEEKNAIGKLAASLVSEGDSLIIDSGTTTLALAGNLTKVNRLSVVTNSIPVAYALNGTNVTTYLCGGTVRDMALVDSDAVAYLSTRRVQKAFMGTTGVRGEEGLTVSSSFQCEVKRRMMESAIEKYVLMDSSKFDIMGINLFADFADLTGVITSRPIRNEKLLRRLEKLRVKVLYSECPVNDRGA